MSENVPLTRRPVAVADGSETLRSASPAVEMTFADELAVYVLATPGVNAPNVAGVPSDSPSVAGTVPPVPVAGSPGTSVGAPLRCRYPALSSCALGDSSSAAPVAAGVGQALGLRRRCPGVSGSAGVVVAR